HKIIRVITLCRLYCRRGLARRNDRTPAHAEEVGNERLYVSHGPILTWRCSQGFLRLVRTVRHVLKALFDDPQALPHLRNPYLRAVVAVAVVACRDVEGKPVVAG